MVMGVPNTEVGDTDARTAWLASCITRMLELSSDGQLHDQHAAQAAGRLWEACGQELTPADAAEQWLGLQAPTPGVSHVLELEQTVDHSPGRSDYPPVPRLERKP